MSKRIVLTGGPSAGKTTIAKYLVKEFPDRLILVPETATMLYKGGFPRTTMPKLKFHQQKAIYHVQVEMEDLLQETYPDRVLLCDRGSLDGRAYWLDEQRDFFKENLTNEKAELLRYSDVILLRVALPNDYNSNHSFERIESYSEAIELEKKIKLAWCKHSKLNVVEHYQTFHEKLLAVSDLVRKSLQNIQ